MTTQVPGWLAVAVSVVVALVSASVTYLGMRLNNEREDARQARSDRSEEVRFWRGERLASYTEFLTDCDRFTAFARSINVELSAETIDDQAVLEVLEKVREAAKRIDKSAVSVEIRGSVEAANLGQDIVLGVYAYMNSVSLERIRYLKHADVKEEEEAEFRKRDDELLELIVNFTALIRAELNIREV